MNDELKNFINQNLDLIDENTKESWEKVYKKISQEITGEFTEMLLSARINDPAAIMGYIPSNYLRKSNIQKYSISKNVANIYQEAFYDCSSLTEIVIPDSVTSIGYWAFSGCSSLTNIKFNGTLEKWYRIKKQSPWNSDTPHMKIICTDGVINL